MNLQQVRNVCKSQDYSDNRLNYTRQCYLSFLKENLDNPKFSFKTKGDGRRRVVSVYNEKGKIELLMFFDYLSVTDEDWDFINSLKTGEEVDVE